MIQVEGDGRTVWVNGAMGAIGRFGPLGIDIHGPQNDSCLDCQHKKTDIIDWEHFVRSMVDIYQIPEKLLRDHTPARFR